MVHLLAAIGAFAIVLVEYRRILLNPKSPERNRETASTIILFAILGAANLWVVFD